MLLLVINKNMKNIENKNKKPLDKLGFNFWTGVVLIFFLLLAGVLRVLTPPQEKIAENSFASQNFDNSSSTIKKISFLGQELVLPEFFKIYQASVNQSIADEVANKIIAENLLVESEKRSNYWESETSSLFKSDYENRYTFSSYSGEEGSLDVIIVPEQAIQTCLNFYKKHQVSVELIPQLDSILYLDSGLEQGVVEKNLATFMQIPLTYELDGYKVFFENQDGYPFFCRVNNQYFLERVVFKDFFQSFQESVKLPPVTINQALDNIKKGSVSIINAESQFSPKIDLNWINEAELYSVEIEYRYDDQLKIAYPFYRFEGKLTNSAGVNIQATLITPAVATDRADD